MFLNPPLGQGRWAGFGEEFSSCTTPATPSKNYGLVFEVAFPKPIPLPLLALLSTLRVHYTHHTRTIPSASVWHVIRSVRDLCALRKCQLLRAAAGDGELNQGVTALVAAPLTHSRTSRWRRPTLGLVHDDVTWLRNASRNALETVVL
jgi:hypothetical protein